MDPITLARGTRACAELEIKRSRFLGFAQRIASEGDARAFFEELRSTYPDARHHCTAFSVRGEGNPIERSSDDGEPSGTAGMPMLQTLRGSGLVDVAVLVVRYFGGIKLGTGGLVRAYSDTVSATLDAATTVRLVTQPTWQVEASAADAGRWHSLFEAHDIAVLDVTYGTRALFTVSYRDADAFDSLLASLTSGQASARPCPPTVREVPVRR
ncbi:MAG: YigZ family protein [Bowdeniella nasicola]|nr:YigZ family protein [Bowdeniella nasicola]